MFPFTNVEIKLNNKPASISLLLTFPVAKSRITAINTTDITIKNLTYHHLCLIIKNWKSSMQIA